MGCTSCCGTRELPYAHATGRTLVTPPAVVNGVEYRAKPPPMSRSALDDDDDDVEEEEEEGESPGAGL